MTELFPPFVPNTPSFQSGKPVADEAATDPDFARWLGRLAKEGINPSGSFFGCAHQMRSCPTSSAEADGVVNDRDSTRETEDVCTSLQSPSGVVPMLTIMTVANRIARCLVADMK